jgi:hypothetical protein
MLPGFRYELAIGRRAVVLLSAWRGCRSRCAHRAAPTEPAWVPRAAWTIAMSATTSKPAKPLDYTPDPLSYPPLGLADQAAQGGRGEDLLGEQPR